MFFHWSCFLLKVIKGFFLWKPIRFNIILLVGVKMLWFLMSSNEYVGMNRWHILCESCSLDGFILVVVDPHKSPTPEYTRLCSLGGKGEELFLKRDLPFRAKGKCPTSVSASKIQAQQFDMTLIYLQRDL